MMLNTSNTFYDFQTNNAVLFWICLSQPKGEWRNFFFFFMTIWIEIRASQQMFLSPKCLRSLSTGKRRLMCFTSRPLYSFREDPASLWTKWSTAFFGNSFSVFCKYFVCWNNNTFDQSIQPWVAKDYGIWQR